MSDKQFEKVEPEAEGFKAKQALKRRVEIDDDDDITFLGAYPKKIKQAEIVVNVDVKKEIDFKEGHENNTVFVSNCVKNENEDINVSVRNNSIVKTSTEVGIQKCENNARGYIEDISHLTNTQQEEDGDIINDSVNKVEGIENLITFKGVNEDDTAAVSNFVVKKEMDDDDIIFLGVYPKKIKQEEVVLNVEVGNEIGFKESNENNTVIVSNCIIKKENEDIDANVQNNTVVNIGSEVVVHNCENNVRDGKFDISHLTNTQLGHDGDILNDSGNKLEGVENVISYKEANEDTAVVNNFVVKMENDDADVSTVDYIRQECAIENNLDKDKENGEGIFKKDGNIDKQIEGDIVLKKEIGVDASIANNRTDNILRNCDSNVKSDATVSAGSISLTIKQEKDADDTFNNLEAANLNFDCPSVHIKKENINEVQCSVGPTLITDNSTELTSMMDLNEPLHSNESLASAIFSSDSRNQFDFHFLSKKSDELEVTTDDEELCDTAPSSPVSEDDGITPEDLAVMNLTQTEANGRFESSVFKSTDEFTMKKHCDFYGLSQLDFKTKIDSTDLSYCSLILTAIRKRLEDFKNDSYMNSVECVKNILSVSKGNGANENLNAKPKMTSKSPTRESDQRVSEEPLGRHSPVYTCPRQTPSVFESPETGGFDLNAVTCLKNWQNDEIRKLIYPKIQNGNPRTAAESDLRNNMQVGNVRLKTLASERFPSSAGNSIRINGNSLPKKRTYPASEILEPVISSPIKIGAVPVSDTLVCRENPLSNKAELPKKIQKVVVTAPEISGNVIAHSCLVNDPLKPSLISSLEEETMFAEPSSRVKDLREFLNRKKNGH